MLSTKYRLRLESICKDIASGTEVSLEDMIWASKLAKANTSARGMLSQARRLSWLNTLCEKNEKARDLAGAMLCPDIIEAD